MKYIMCVMITIDNTVRVFLSKRKNDDFLQTNSKNSFQYFINILKINIDFHSYLI